MWMLVGRDPAPDNRRWLVIGTTVRALVALASLSLACDSQDPSVPELGISEERAEALRALGYVDVAEEVPHDASSGTLEYDRERAFPGLNYMTNASDCSSQLVDMAGRVVKSWSFKPCQSWGNSVLLPSGEVLAVHHDAYTERTPEAAAAAASVIKLSWEGELLWQARVVAHHDVGTTPDGRIAVLTRRYRVFPEFHDSIPVSDHSITILSSDGRVEEVASLTEILLASDDYRFREVRPMKKWFGHVDVDLVHANTVEWMHRPELARKNPIYSLDNVMITMRNQNLVAIIDWKRRELVWWWGQEVLDGPHDATVTDRGTILVFDNGLRRSRSRVLELDPVTNQVVWHYRGTKRDAFFSVSRGANQRLPNGNTLITVSDSAGVREVTPAGEVVWRYRNTRKGRDGKPFAIVRTRRFVPADGAPDGHLVPADLID